MNNLNNLVAKHWNYSCSIQSKNNCKLKAINKHQMLIAHNTDKSTLISKYVYRNSQQKHRNTIALEMEFDTKININRIISDDNTVIFFTKYGDMIHYDLNTKVHTLILDTKSEAGIKIASADIFNNKIHIFGCKIYPSTQYLKFNFMQHYSLPVPKSILKHGYYDSSVEHVGKLKTPFDSMHMVRSITLTNNKLCM